MSSNRGVAALLVRGASALLQQGGRQAARHAQTGAAVSVLALESAAAASGPAALRTALSAMSLRSFGASPALQQELSQLLKQEVKYEQDNYEKPEQIANGPPAPFKLTEEPEDTLLTLTRDFNGETVTVDLHVNNQPSPGYEGEEGDEESITTVVFNVTVKKADSSLVFECESDGNSLTINHVSFEPKDGFDSESMYTGPVFDELDDALQGKFQQYLEERGITGDLGEYLRFLIFDKEQREYQAWLRKVDKFVSS